MTAENNTKNELTTKAPDSVKQFCERFNGVVGDALPKHCTKEHYIRALMTAMRRTPKIMQCDAQSISAAILKSAQLGLMPDVNGQCFLVPYKTECTLVIGYQGLIDLSYRTGQLDSIRSDIVCEGDDFDFEDGLTPVFRHRRDLSKPRGAPYAVYAIAEIKGANRPVYVVMSKDEIMAVKAASIGAQSSYSPWNGPFETEMWKKTAIRRLCKLLPKSTELIEALDFEDKQADHIREVEARQVSESVFTPGKHRRVRAPKADAPAIDAPETEGGE